MTEDISEQVETTRVCWGEDDMLFVSDASVTRIFPGIVGRGDHAEIEELVDRYNRCRGDREEITRKHHSLVSGLHLYCVNKSKYTDISVSIVVDTVRVSEEKDAIPHSHARIRLTDWAGRPHYDPQSNCLVGTPLFTYESDHVLGHTGSDYRDYPLGPLFLNSHTTIKEIEANFAQFPGQNRELFKQHDVSLLSTHIPGSGIVWSRYTYCWPLISQGKLVLDSP